MNKKVKEKEFQHERIENCNICKKNIDTEKQPWDTIIEYTGDTIRSIKFYHRSCLKSLIEEKGEKVKQELEDRWENKAGKMVGKIREKMMGAQPQNA